MRKLKYILPLLTATLLLLPGMAAEAATTKKELAAGTKNTSLSIVLSDKQSVEGLISVKSKTSGKTIKLQSVSVQTSDSSKTAVCESSGKKIYMVTKGDAVTTTVTIKVDFSGDGDYVVALKGGCTDKEGNYESDGIKETFQVTVGTSTSESEEENDNDEETEEEEETDEEEETEEDEVTEEEEETETTTSDSKKDKKEQSGKISKTDKETVKVLDEDEQILEDFIEEVEEELKKEEKTEKEKVVRSPKSLGSFFRYLKNFWFVFVILLLILLIAVHMLWRLLRKNRKNDYDGAPMVDYNIEDDD